MHVYIKIFLVINLGYLAQGQGASCVLEGVTSAEWSMSYSNPNVIKDTFSGEVQVFNTSNITDVSVDLGQYLEVFFIGDVLTVSTSSAYADYEQNEVNNYFYTTIKFKCNDGLLTQLEFRQSIEDTNNNIPTFSVPHFTYTIFMPVPASYDLTNVQPIVVTDYDLSNFKVQFFLDTNTYLELSYASKTDKQYYAKLTTLQELTAPFNATYTMLVYDDGFPPLSSSAQLTVQILNMKN